MPCLSFHVYWNQQNFSLGLFLLFFKSKINMGQPESCQGSDTLYVKLPVLSELLDALENPNALEHQLCCQHFQTIFFYFIITCIMWHSGIPVTNLTMLDAVRT